MTQPEVFAYYFPNYHLDARNQRHHGQGWSEWKLVREARPRFENHQQPKVPLWGYEDEADPQVMARKIEAAASHGLSGWIFDWYWYEDGPFLERALDEGFLGAPNNAQQKFALMWANHDWVDIHPWTAGQEPELLYPGALSREGWERLTDVVVEKYFRHPSYWKLDGCPYFSIYELAKFIIGMGGVEGALDAMNSFRAKVKRAGFPDLHLNVTAWGLSEWSFRVLPVEERVENPVEIAQKLGAQSVTPYVWIHHFPLDRHFPRADYEQVANANYALWDELGALPCAFFPNVSMGWDPSPRTDQSQPYENVGYPFTSIIEGTPAQFRAALERAKSWCQQQGSGAITLNAWNEWTEGSYLEPDEQHGTSFLEAIRDVFGSG